MKRNVANYVLKINGVPTEVERDIPQTPADEPFRWPEVMPEEFLTIDEMVDHLTGKVVDTDKFIATPREDLVMWHHGFGTAIRNTYGLWHPSNPLVVPGDMGDGHPDGISMKVIEKLWEKLRA